MFFQSRWGHGPARAQAQVRARALSFAFALAWAAGALPAATARADDGLKDRPEPRAATPAPARPRLVPLGRSVAQDQGAWVVDYRLRLVGPTGLVLEPGAVAVKVEGWVSNARVPSHAVPRFSTLSVPAADAAMEQLGEVVASSDESQRCLEKLIVTVWDGDGPPPGPKRSHARAIASANTNAPAAPAPFIALAPGTVLRVRLRLEHHHVLYGTYDPLLGVRAVELTAAGATVRDRAPLDREHYLALPRYEWPEPPLERRGTRHARSGADSLKLEAHVPGHHYYRFPERPVRYATRMRLRFWYLIAAGTEGPCRYRIAQYKDTPTSWRQLNRAGFEGTLQRVGRWTRVERVFNTDAEATTLALDFRIDGDSEVGEMWIDDVRLDVVGSPGAAGP